MARLLALDQGTTSSRAVVFDEAGRVVASAQQEIAQHFPAPGRVEHDPEEIWRTQRETAEAALDAAGTPRPAALGITNQRETTLLWDRRTGTPLHRAIVWQDRRTADALAAWRAAGREEAVRRRTGLVLDPYFSASKLAWLLEHVPDARARAEAGELAFGTVDSWLLWRLTEGRVHATDVSNASRTLLVDIERGTWDDALLDLFGVPRAVLPEIVDSSGVVGEVRTSGPLRGLPVAGIAGDQQAALFGQACLRPGLAKCTYGTGCFLLMNTGDRAVIGEQRLLATTAWRIRGETTWAIEGSVFMGGATVQWLRDGLGLVASAGEVEALARRVEDTGGLMLVPAFAGLGAPWWDAHARGLLVGITRGTTGAHVARAALEGIAFQVADVVDAMRAETGIPIGELRVDGGASANDLLMQMQADLLQVPVVRAAVAETTALGVAWLAGLATGQLPDLDAVDRTWRSDRTWRPARPASEAASRRARWHDAVARARGWADPGR